VGGGGPPGGGYGPAWSRTHLFTAADVASRFYDLKWNGDALAALGGGR
jgi:hypothetical protein